MDSIAATRYATALFQIGVEEGSLDRLLAELECLEEVFHENSDCLRLLGAPVVPKAEKLQMLTTAFGGKLATPLENLLSILVEKGRFSVFPQMAQVFRRLVYQEKGIQEAVAITALPLTPALADKLTEKLSGITGKKILLKNQVDSTILGGVVLRMDGSELDDSVKNRMETLRQQIDAAAL